MIYALLKSNYDELINSNIFAEDKTFNSLAFVVH